MNLTDPAQARCCDYDAFTAADCPTAHRRGAPPWNDIEAVLVAETHRLDQCLFIAGHDDRRWRIFDDHPAIPAKKHAPDWRSDDGCLAQQRGQFIRNPRSLQCLRRLAPAADRKTHPGPLVVVASYLHACVPPTQSCCQSRPQGRLVTIETLPSCGNTLSTQAKK
jgi:hypothetical protein